LRVRRALLWALAGSVVVHAAFSLWPADDADAPPPPPLVATITELPPPPLPTAQPAPPKPRPRVVAATPAAPVAALEPPPAAEPAPIDPTPDAIAAGPVAPTAVDEPAPPAPAVATAPPQKSLPPRVDLVYKAFLGTRGFLIGEATYRFEHAGGEYRITTVGEARGLAALILRGQGRIESRGTITAAGLQPLEFSVERGSRDKRETASFDWETGIVTLQEQQTAALELPTYDPLALMWQYYFAPPAADEVTVAIATTRRLARYTLTREGRDAIAWGGGGDIDTERWHRRSEDGKTDSWVWLAPSLRFIPVKIRVTNTDRGTVEALLDSIRVDEAPPS
jgi:hypothetical protein